MSRNSKRQKDGAKHRDQNRIDHAARSSEAQSAHDEAANYGSDDTDDDIHERAIPAAAHDLAGKPACDQADDDPPQNYHMILPDGAAIEFPPGNTAVKPELVMLATCNLRLPLRVEELWKYLEGFGRR